MEERVDSRSVWEVTSLPTPTPTPRPLPPVFLPVHLVAFPDNIAGLRTLN